MIPEVKACTVTQCYYNKEQKCNAHAITVGSSDPACETFISTSDHTNKKAEGEVGACHVTQCEYNMGMYCHACGDIQVGMQGDKALCQTFEPR